MMNKVVVLISVGTKESGMVITDYVWDKAKVTVLPVYRMTELYNT